MGRTTETSDDRCIRCDVGIGAQALCDSGLCVECDPDAAAEEGALWGDSAEATASATDSTPDVWLWCAHLAHVEVDAIDYAHPPRTDDAALAEMAMLRDAGRRFLAKADEVAGRELGDDEWSASLERFSSAAVLA